MTRILQTAVVVGVFLLSSLEAGAELNNALLSRPVTVLEHALMKLSLSLDQYSESMGKRNYSRDYKPTGDGYTQGSFYQDPDSRRLIANTVIAIDSIDDPWKETCKKHVSLEASILFDSEVPGDRGAALVLFDQIQATTEQKVSAYHALLDSIRVRLMFLKTDGDSYYARTCEYDVRTKSVTFNEERGTRKRPRR